MRSQFAARIRLVFLGVFLLALALSTRLYFVQIVNGEEFSSRADRQYVSSGQGLYDRGFIYFTGNAGERIAGAAIKSGFTVAVNPSILENPKEVYEHLSPIIPIDEETFFIRTGKKDDPYEEVARRVSPDAARAVEALAIDGLNVYTERWRFYPGETLAAHTLGFVGWDGEKESGRYGLERYYEDTLNRTSKNVYVNFFAELFAGLSSAFLAPVEKRDGHIVTTIEPSVQLFLERALRETHDEWDAKQTGGIIINPNTGEIYALGAYPTFDLNAFSEASDASVFGNPLIENVFEMGSIVKPLTMAAGIDAGAVMAETSYVDTGSITRDGLTISNFDQKGRGVTTMQGVLNESLNTGAAFVVEKTGNETFRKYMLAYGIGEETGIDLPNESAGLIENLNSPRDVEYVTASFGQGIAITPIAMVRALSSLANGGELITPHLVKKVQYTSGLAKDVSWEHQKNRVLKKETAEEITRMLVHVVDNALLGGMVKKPEYSIAAKTGTAQIAKTSERGYYEDRFLHSFFGYVPAYDARFLVFLFTLEPRGVRYASHTLTEPFMDIVSFLINHYDIPPDR